jgi:hypothetical protein
LKLARMVDSYDARLSPDIHLRRSVALDAGADRRGALLADVPIRHAARGEDPMIGNGDGPRPIWIPGHARRHQRTADLDIRWMPACQCGWTFYSSVRSLRIAHRTHGYHLDRVHTARGALS